MARAAGKSTIGQKSQGIHALLGPGVLTKIRKIARTASRRFGAVAYVAEGGAAVLPFTRDDVLVIDMGERAVKSGATNPWQVEKLYRKGVRIFTRQNLHAKIFALGDIVIVGSANLSQRSLRNDEAAVVIRDNVLRRDVQRQIES
jgi:hypothetical protein